LDGSIKGLVETAVFIEQGARQRLQMNHPQYGFAFAEGGKISHGEPSQTEKQASLRAERSNLCLKKRLLRHLQFLAMTVLSLYLRSQEVANFYP
jgi:hypothetical protein